jgi:uncharacterized membrane protein
MFMTPRSRGFKGPARVPASYLSHPVHAMLVQLPIVLLVGAFALDTVGKWSIPLDSEALWLLRAGLLSGLLVAILGAVDAARAERNGLADDSTTSVINLSAAGLLLFWVALLSRGTVGRASNYTLMMEAVGTSSLARASLVAIASFRRERQGRRLARDGRSDPIPFPAYNPSRSSSLLSPP